MYRYKMSDLTGLLDRLNRTAGAEPKAYREATKEEQAAGFFSVANVGTYYLEGAYGGHKLVQIVNHGGGVRDVLRSGFVSKREAYHLIGAYVDGIETPAPDSRDAVAAIRERAGTIEDAIKERQEGRAKFEREQAEREGAAS